MKKTIEIQCEDCRGSGLYRGMWERDGFAVVCFRCKGTGKRLFEYVPAGPRSTKAGVTRVIQCNPGIVVGGDDPQEFGGMSYEDWLKGKPFPPGSEMRRFTCPAWWFQCVPGGGKPEWDWCNEGMRLGDRFSGCKRFACKERCWERWDAKPEGSAT